jgi:hypothetical protein
MAFPKDTFQDVSPHDGVDALLLLRHRLYVAASETLPNESYSRCSGIRGVKTSDTSENAHGAKTEAENFPRSHPFYILLATRAGLAHHFDGLFLVDRTPAFSSCRVFVAFDFKSLCSFRLQPSHDVMRGEMGKPGCEG